MAESSAANAGNRMQPRQWEDNGMPFFFSESAMNGPDSADTMLGLYSNSFIGNGGDDVILGDLGGLNLFYTGEPNGSIAGAVNIDTALLWTTDENPMFADSTIPHASAFVEATIGQSEFFAVTLVA